MDDRLQQLRAQIWDEPSERELRIQELQEEVGRLQERVFEIIEAYPDEHRAIIEGYIYNAAELEMQAVMQAFRKGKKLGEEIGKNKDMPLYR